MHVCVCTSACTCVVRASLKEPQWQCSWGRSELLVTIKGGRLVKTSPVLPGRAKVSLKRFFWGALNVVKWSPPESGHSKRPSLTTTAKQTLSSLPQTCLFPSNTHGHDRASRYPTWRTRETEYTYTTSPVLFFTCVDVTSPSLFMNTFA